MNRDIEATITDKIQMDDQWRYAWKQVRINSTTGEAEDPLTAREGSTTLGYALERNNVEVETDTRVTLRTWGWADGQMLWTFSAPVTDGGSTTTTTTTPGPCTGVCTWDWDNDTKIWTRTDSTCSAGCACFAPTFCPDTECATTQTGCGHFPDDQASPKCGGSPPCTTTPGPGCMDGCEWKCVPGCGWLQLSSGCSSACPCPPPDSPCDSPCADVSTACNYTPPECRGSCRWVWVTPGDFWHKLADDCRDNTGNPNPNVGCSCDYPDASGSACGDETVTRCYFHDASSDPCSQATTTTPGPDCSGHCLWGTSDGEEFDTVISPCADGCDCNPPDREPVDECDTAQGSCFSSATSTTTTTTPGPCGECFWACICAPVGPGVPSPNNCGCITYLYPFDLINFLPCPSGITYNIPAAIGTPKKMCVNAADMDCMINQINAQGSVITFTNPADVFSCSLCASSCGGQPDPNPRMQFGAYRWLSNNMCGFYGQTCECPQTEPPTDCPEGCIDCDGPITCSGPCVPDVSPAKAYCNFACDPTTTTTPAPTTTTTTPEPTTTTTAGPCGDGLCSSFFVELFAPFAYSDFVPRTGCTFEWENSRILLTSGFPPPSNFWSLTDKLTGCAYQLDEFSADGIGTYDLVNDPDTSGCASTAVVSCPG